MSEPETRTVRAPEEGTESPLLCLTGDVMSGRGIDQILPRPGDPRIFEPYVRSALEYVRLAERRNGPIPRPVETAYVWGIARERLAREAPDLRIVNLETAITADGAPEPKGIEIFEGRPILYGCGDFPNDYEGIEGYGAFRDDLAVAYLARFPSAGERLESLRLLPFRIRNFRLERAPAEDIAWLRRTLDRESRRFGIRVVPGGEEALQVEG